MHRSTRSLAVVFGLCLLGSTNAAAAVTRYVDRDGCDGGFSTCSALVESSYRTVGTADHSVTWAGLEQSVAPAAITGAPIGVAGTQASGIGCNDPSGCIGGPGEPPIVTPEPMTMALVATGLAGMGGIGFLRRRREQRGG